MISGGFWGDLNKALQFVAAKLDLDETRHEKADISYHAVGEWLSAENSPLKQYRPEIYPQGSFLLGTVIKPLEGDYDLDFVCLFENGLGLSSQETYQLIGERLRANGTYASMLEPKNRCWRLVYAGDFHIDIIPAIPDLERGNTAILVPDREVTDWTKSDAKGYAAWFKGKMQVQYNLVRASLAQKYKKEIEEIPDYLVKTELQRVVQLMKRHRDMTFQGDKKEKDKPISIIITTLAGLVYEAQGYQSDLFQTLRLMAEYMPQQVNPSIPRIPNPTNYEEDFTDKWGDNPKRERAFFEWIALLKADLDELGKISSISECEGKLKQMFGESVVPENLKELSTASPIVVAAKSRFDVTHKKPLEWTFIPSCYVTIKAIKKSGVTKGVMPKKFKNNSSHLIKGLSLVYTAITNADGDFKVQWQVVNTGYQAKINNQLRGDFYPSSGMTAEGFFRKESTSYTGMHWVEAFIVKNGCCIARSGEFVINIK